MKSINSILLVAFVFGAVSLLAAQQSQTFAPPNVAPEVVTTANAVNSAVTEPIAGDGEMMNPPEASKSAAPGGADSENKPVIEGNPEASQNLIEFGGPG
jgi:hypothetical protein